MVVPAAEWSVALHHAAFDTFAHVEERRMHGVC
jgi:hypothetical protein